MSEFIDVVRTDNATALSRLGSSKALYADTEGELEPHSVLAAAADAESAAAETFAVWVEDEKDVDAADAFAATATEERDHYRTVEAELDGHTTERVPAIQTYLRGLTDTPERVGALVGRTLVAEKSKEQLIGFFVGQADPQTAALFRSMGDDLDAQLERAVTLVDAFDDAERERAKAAADEAIQLAYNEYTEALESIGVNPKPVC